MFYGTFQIGSVCKNQCVSIDDCQQYLFYAVQEIKNKYKWQIDYEKLAETNDLERAKALLKLTQTQKFMLALRDIERLHEVPYDLSVTRSESITVVTN